MNAYNEIINFVLSFIKLKADPCNRSFGIGRMEVFVLSVNEVCKKIQNTSRKNIKHLEICDFCVTHTHTHFSRAYITTYSLKTIS